MPRTDILTYDDVVAAHPGETGEPLVALREKPGLVLEPIPAGKISLCGERHLLRATVAAKLLTAAAALHQGNSALSLKVLSTYRDPRYQAAWHAEIKAGILARNPELSDLAAARSANQLVAAPEVAGHTCGAAVDVTIVNNGCPIEMGAGYLDFDDPKIQVFADGIVAEARRNRLLLRDILLAQGFAPFNGEWWHFSYGDREWAAYYGNPAALFSPIPSEVAFAAATE